MFVVLTQMWLITPFKHEASSVPRKTNASTLNFGLRALVMPVSDEPILKRNL